MAVADLPFPDALVQEIGMPGHELGLPVLDLLGSFCAQARPNRRASLREVLAHVRENAFRRAESRRGIVGAQSVVKARESLAEPLDLGSTEASVTEQHIRADCIRK